MGRRGPKGMRAWHEGLVFLLLVSICVAAIYHVHIWMGLLGALPQSIYASLECWNEGRFCFKYRCQLGQGLFKSLKLKIPYQTDLLKVLLGSSEP